MHPRTVIAERILLTLWVGGLWMIGYMAVPILFAELDDIHLAGQLAGQMFMALNYFGLVAGGLLLLSNRLYDPVGLDWRAVTLILMLVFILINEFGISPMMQDLKASGIPEGSEAAAQFGRLHGVSSFFYLIESLLGLGLVIAGVRKPKVSD